VQKHFRKCNLDASKVSLGADFLDLSPHEKTIEVLRLPDFLSILFQGY